MDVTNIHTALIITAAGVEIAPAATVTLAKDDYKSVEHMVGEFLEAGVDKTPKADPKAD